MNLTGTDWATERCEIHDMMACQDCLDRSGLRRVSGSNEVRFRNDCGIATFAELTGMDYEFSSEVLREAGFRPSNGTPTNGLLSALDAVGYSVRELTGTVRLESAPVASKGRKFMVAGWTRREGHAWTIIDGTVNRDFMRYSRISYRIWEVTE
jgi:hypothetical protein